VIRPFGFRDTLAIRKLQSNTQRLDWPEGLISVRSPLRMMLLARVSHLNLGAPAFVCPGTDGLGVAQGYVQVLPQRDRPDWDIIALGPALDGRSATQWVWTHLLERLGQQAGELGILRLFARIAEDSPAEDVLRACDFSPYAAQVVMTRPESTRGADAGAGKGPAIAPRERQPRDEWALHQLYARATPTQVQLAEGQASLERYALNLGLQGLGEEYVCESQGSLRGYLGIASGAQGHAWRLVMDPKEPQEGLQLLAWGLERLARRSDKPVYGLVREYDQPVISWLYERGYAVAARQKLMVKQLAIRVKEPVLKLAPALEQRMEPAHTRSCEGFKIGKA